jgi:undecaprenyl-diphosphatase
MAHITEFNRRFCLAIERTRPQAVGNYFQRLDRAEISFVARLNGLTRYRWIRALAIVISRGGNGWLYVGVAAALLLGVGGSRGWLVFWAAGLSALLAHGVYPIVKSFAGRPRPYESFRDVEKLGSPLDVYSCPSGHSMTATAVFVVVGVAFPESLPIGGGVWTLLGWARLASAHHYPSDVFIGAVLGAVAALPVCLMMLR